MLADEGPTTFISTQVVQPILSWLNIFLYMHRAMQAHACTIICQHACAHLHMHGLQSNMYVSARQTTVLADIAAVATTLPPTHPDATASRHLRRCSAERSFCFFKSTRIKSSRVAHNTMCSTSWARGNIARNLRTSHATPCATICRSWRLPMIATQPG